VSLAGLAVTKTSDLYPFGEVFLGNLKSRDWEAMKTKITYDCFHCEETLDIAFAILY